MSNTVENLTELPAKQTKSSPFYLLLLGAPIGFILAVLAVKFVNWALPVEDAAQFKSLIFGAFGGGGTGASLLGGAALMGRSLLMTGGKIANNTPNAAPDLTGLVTGLLANNLAQPKINFDYGLDGLGCKGAGGPEEGYAGFVDANNNGIDDNDEGGVQDDEAI